MRTNFIAAILGAIVLWLMPDAALAQCTGQSVAGAICGNPTGATAPPRFAQPSAFGLGGGVTSLGGLTGAITCGANLTCAGGSISATGGGGSGTVTSVATALPITGGAITSTGTIGCATCVTSASALTANRLIIGGGLQATSALGSLGTTTTVLHGNAAGAPTFGAVALAADVSGTLPVANGGTGLTAGTSGGVPTYTASGTLTSSGVLSANDPVIGGGAGAVVASGTRSGTTTIFTTRTVTGFTPGNCLQSDANGNIADAGGACTTGGGGGTVAAGTAGQLAYYGSTGTTVSGNADITISSGVVTVGIAGSVLGSVKVTGNTSGTITIQPQAAAGTYNFNLPIAAGTSGAPLLSAGGGASPMTFGTVGVAFGGTGLTAGTSGGILGFTASGTIASSIALTANALVLGGGAGATPTPMGSLGTTITVLHGNAAGAPTFASVISADLNITTTTCTNQFATAISATAVLTCTTATLASAQFANQGTTATVLHGNAAGNPTFAAVNMASEVTGTLAVANGGTGAATLTNHGVLVGAGTSAITQLTAAVAGTVLAGQGATSDPAFTATPTLGVAGTTLGSVALAGNTSGTVTISVNAIAGTWTLTVPASGGTNGQFLQSNGSGVTTWAAPAGGITGLANPTGTVGLTAVNGSATTAMRSDGAPALSQSIIPTWSGQHTFQAATLFGDGTVSLPGIAFSGDTDSGIYRIGANNIGVGVNGAKVLDIAAAGLATTGSVTASTRFIASAAIGYTGIDNVTGMDLATALTGKLYANSVPVLQWVQTQITAFATIVGVGAGSTLAYSFNGDSNTGIYSSATDTINFSVQGHSIFQITENTVGVPFVTATAGVIVNPARTLATAGGLNWNDVEVSPTTTLLTGTTTVTAIARVGIFAGTLSHNDSMTNTVTLAEGLYVEPPTAGTGVTITNAFAARFAGNVYMNASSYINFTVSSGSGGCGFRDNGGTMQVANCSAPGTWANFGTGGGATVCTTTALSVQYNAAGSLGCVSGVTSDGTLLQHAAGSFALRDSSAAFNVIINATDPATISATRTLTLGMGNVAHTVNFGTTANTITFPNVASDTVVMAAAAQTLTNKTLTSPALGGTVTGNNTIPLTILAQSAANTMLGNWTGSTANVLANAMPSCADTGTNHLNYVAGTGITCGTAGVGIASNNTWTGTNLFQGPLVTGVTQTITSATGAKWDDFSTNGTGQSTTVTGTTTITKFVQNNFKASTAISNSNGLTITDAANVYIGGAPAYGGAGGTFTNGPWALWVDNTNGGRVKFTDTTAATSKTDGSVVLAGGLSVGGAMVSDTLKVITMANTATTSAVCYNTGTGLFTYDGTVGTCTVSDGRLKNIDGPLVNSLARLLQIKGIYYHWKDPKSYGVGRKIGIIAQDVEKVFPELVGTDGEGKKSADYQHLTAPIIEALRELKADNDNLRAQLELLKRVPQRRAAK